MANMRDRDMTYQPFTIDGADRPGPWVVACDHATNTVPPFVGKGSLGLPASEMARHIAYDIGAAGVCLALGALLNAPVICSNFSRLVIDPNRGADDPTLLMKLYDGTLIPANRNADRTDLEARITHCYRPYHDALETLMSRPGAILLGVHSFTPQLKGRPPRPWQVGILYARDTRLAHPALHRLRAEPDLIVGDNEPYTGDLKGDTLDQHVLTPGRNGVLLELRNDLIARAETQHDWAQRLAPLLDAARQDANL